MPRTRLSRLARTATALAFASIALTGCADSVRDGSAVAPNAEQSTSAVPATPEATPTETEDAGAVRITGGYQADLAAVGFDPDPEDFEVVTDRHEENLCEEPMESDNEVFNFNRFERNVEDTAENPGPDMVRVVVEYNCPNRSEAVEKILAGLGH